MNAVRETAAPWFIRQAEFDGVAIVLLDDAMDDEAHKDHGGWPRYQVLSTHGWRDCDICGKSHWLDLETYRMVYEGDSLEEAEAAYAELERQLLAGGTAAPPAL